MTKRRAAKKPKAPGVGIGRRPAAKPAPAAASRPAGTRTRAGAAPRASAGAPAHHAHAAAAPRPVCCAIVTVSDTRGAAEDRSGNTIQRLLEAAGHLTVDRAWVKDEPRAIRAAVREALGRRSVDAVIVTGGTGVATRDVTPDALGPLLSKWIPGFGELFRARSWAAIGSAAWLSRADAGIARDRLVVMLPGSTAAVELAMKELLLPELAHVVRLLGRFQPGE